MPKIFQPQRTGWFHWFTGQFFWFVGTGLPTVWGTLGAADLVDPVVGVVSTMCIAGGVAVRVASASTITTATNSSVAAAAASATATTTPTTVAAM
jgi:hypothetical protein